MANTPQPSVPPGRRKAIKRTFSVAKLQANDEDDEDDEDDQINTKYIKHSDNIQLDSSFNNIQQSPLKKNFSDTTNVTSPADSGYDISVGGTPGSYKQCKYVQPGSSGCVSGNISDSECGTPALVQRTLGPFSPDFVPTLPVKKTSAPLCPLSLKSFLQKKFALFKEEVHPSGIADILFTDGIISEKDIEMIREEKFRFEKCDILLKSIVRSPLKDDIHTPRKVISAFEKEGYGHLFKDIESRKVRPKEPTDNQLLSEEEIKTRLYLNSSSLEEEFEPLVIIDDLVAEEVLSLDEHQDIKNTGFKPHRVQYLIRYILRKSRRDFWSFCNVLERHNPSLAEQLKNGTPSTAVADQKGAPLVDITFVKKSVATFERKNRPFDEEKTEVKLLFVGDGKEEEQMIVDSYSPDVNFDLQEENMEIGFEILSIEYSCIRINLASMSRYSQMAFLKRCRDSPIFLEKWLQHLITAEHIERLKQKNIDKMSFQINLSLPDLDERTCYCKLTKEAIVQHYSLLEKDLKSVNEIIQTFGNYEGFDEGTRQMFKQLLEKNASGNRTERFLRKLLELSDTRLHLCLLERELWNTDKELLRQVIKVEHTHKEIKLTVTDIRRNMNFLVDELEPRHFREMLRSLEGSESIVGKVMSTAPRKERCIELLNFIIQKKNTDRFVQELERQKKSHVVEFLIASKEDNEQIDLKEALVYNIKLIVDEIEPRAFRQMFVERREIKAKDYDMINKLATRRQRAICLMKNILNRNGSTMKCFMDALELAGYRHIVCLINNRIDSYKECPRLYQSLLGGQNTVNITGEFQLDLKQGVVKESPLQVYLHRAIYSSNTSDKENENILKEETSSTSAGVSSSEIAAKNKRTFEWVQMQQKDRKRKLNESDATGQPAYKQFRSELAMDVYGEYSPSTSPTLGMIRPSDFADNCSSPRLTRSLSKDSDGQRWYEDITPPSSPKSMEEPHIVIETPCPPLNMNQTKHQDFQFYEPLDASSHSFSFKGRVISSWTAEVEQAYFDNDDIETLLSRLKETV